jgi:hypothetical protein
MGFKREIAKENYARQKEWRGRWQTKENLLSSIELSTVAKLLRTELEKTGEVVTLFDRGNISERDSIKGARRRLERILDKIESTNGYKNVPRTSFPFTKSIRETQLSIKKLSGKE